MQIFLSQLALIKTNCTSLYLFFNYLMKTSYEFILYMRKGVVYYKEDREDERFSFVKYLQDVIVLIEKLETNTSMIIVACYALIDGHLYGQSIEGSYLRCVSTLEAQGILWEIHKG